MSVWDGQREAMRLMVPVLMRKKQMEREDQQKQMELQAAAEKLEQERMDKQQKLEQEAFNAQLKYTQGMLKEAYGKGDVQGVQAFGEPLAQMGMPVPAQQVAGPPGANGLPPLQYFAAPQPGPKSFQEMAVGAMPPGAGLPEIQAASQGMQRPDMSDAALHQRAQAGDANAQAVLDAMYANKKKVAAAGASRVDVRSMGTIPPGYRVEYDEAGNPKQMAPIPGGPVAKEEEETKKKEYERQQGIARAGGTVIQDLQRGLDIVSENRLAVGAPAAVLRNVWETDARAVEGFVQSALSNVGLDTLQRMRENSPTGGALGQVPIQQQKRLEQVLGSLDITQEPAIVEDNLKRVINIYMDLVHGTPEEIVNMVAEGKIDAKRAADVMRRHKLSFDEFGFSTGETEKPFPGAPEVGIVEDGYRYKGGDPSVKRNWEKVK